MSGASPSDPDGELHQYYEQVRTRARRLLRRDESDDEASLVASDCLRLAEENEVLVQATELLRRLMRRSLDRREQENELLLRLVKTRIERGADRTRAVQFLRELGFDNLASEISE